MQNLSMKMNAARFSAGDARCEVPMNVTYDSHFLDGVRYFNECEFFEAHEAWEELWTEYQGPSRRFYQGLIQVAVCLHHFGNGNTRGAKKLYHSSRKYLEEYRPRHGGVDVTKLLDDLQRCCQELLDAGDEYPEITIDPEKIPEIQLDPPAS
jgi:predicted metal-dependent hydrolase